MHEKKPNLLLQRIFDLRKSKKITLEQLGKVINVNGANFGGIENGRVVLKASDIPKIAKFLGVEAWQLFVEGPYQHLLPVTEEEKEELLALRKVRGARNKPNSKSL